jgi:tyrosine-protein kinase Etk/Wzc
MPETVINPSPENGEVHLLDYLVILAKHSRTIIFISVAVTVLTYLILFILPNKYTAKAQLLSPQQNLTLSAQLLDLMSGGVTPGARAGGIGAGPGGIAASLLGLKSPVDLYIAMMTTNTVFDHIIHRFNLMKLYKSKYLEDARKTLNQDTKITPSPKGPIIVIELTATTPKLAAEMANAFIEELDLLLRELGTEEAKGRLAFLEKERLQASQNLSKAEELLRTFSEKNGVLQIDTQTRGAIEYIASLRAKIDAQEVNTKVLRQQATSFNYDVIRMETEIKGLKEKLRVAESQWENIISEVCMPTSRAPTLGLDYLRLFREVKFQESLYQLFTKTVEIARLDMVRDVAVVQVLDPAKPPERRSNKRLLPSVVSGIITFFIMIFVVFGREYMQNIKNREDDVQRLNELKSYLIPWKSILRKMKNIISLKR